MEEKYLRIIIEGADLTGKTTITQYLTDKYNLSRVHVTSKDPNTYEFYKHTLDKTNVVFDRHFIGEMIYPDIFNREFNLTKETFRELLEKSRELEYKIFVITASEEVLQQRLKTRNEPEEVQKRLMEINKRFVKIANEYNIKLIDTTKTTEEQLKEMIDNEIQNYE